MGLWRYRRMRRIALVFSTISVILMHFDARGTLAFGVGNARVNWTSADGHWDGVPIRYDY